MTQEGTLLSINFDSVPDTIPKVPNGLYDLKINTTKINPPKQKADGTMGSATVEVELEILNAPMIQVQDQPYDLNGRKLRDFISIKMETKLKRLFKSAGADVGAQGADIRNLVGKVCRAAVVNAVVQKPNETAREFPNIQDYLIPGDAGFAKA